MVEETIRTFKNGGTFYTVNGEYYYSSKIQAYLKFHYVEITGQTGGFSDLLALSDDDYSTLINKVVDSSGSDIDRVLKCASYWMPEGVTRGI